MVESTQICAIIGLKDRIVEGVVVGRDRKLEKSSAARTHILMGVPLLYLLSWQFRVGGRTDLLASQRTSSSATGQI